MKKKILIVDDSKFSCDIIASMLSGLDCDVIIAQDGEEGVKRAIEEKPNLIIMDFILPKKTGLEVTREIKSNEITKSIPIIMISSFRELYDELKSTYNFNPDVFLPKPVEKRELLKYVQQLLMG
ncbi:MAG: response regulator [Candidatus Firestonebacteria bacterium]